jgi:hypothetical protein
LVARLARKAEQQVSPAYSPSPRHSIESIKCEEMLVIGDRRYAVHKVTNKRSRTTLTTGPLFRVSGAIYVVTDGHRKRVLIIPSDDLIRAYFPRAGGTVKRAKGTVKRSITFFAKNAPLDFDWYEEKWGRLGRKNSRTPRRHH